MISMNLIRLLFFICIIIKVTNTFACTIEIEDHITKKKISYRIQNFQHMIKTPKSKIKCGIVKLSKGYVVECRADKFGTIGLKHILKKSDYSLFALHNAAGRKVNVVYISSCEF